ncbi:hypothetical protein V5799_017142 [Amblyomma americanum]|uniref:Uncharacterized protein n=1 Tax=Amblyomma americanum TaxID=6943 RepID=A0AAQ4F396_AMBAM
MAAEAIVRIVNWRSAFSDAREAFASTQYENRALRGGVAAGAATAGDERFQRGSSAVGIVLRRYWIPQAACHLNTQWNCNLTRESSPPSPRKAGM